MCKCVKWRNRWITPSEHPYGLLNLRTFLSLFPGFASPLSLFLPLPLPLPLPGLEFGGEVGGVGGEGGGGRLLLHCPISWPMLFQHPGSVCAKGMRLGCVKMNQSLIIQVDD